MSSIAKGSIDLLPEIPEEEIIKVEKKGKINVFAVFSIFTILFLSVFILLGNLFATVEYNITNQRLADTNRKIMDLQYVELRQRTLNEKMSAYASVRSQDFSADVVLSYLLSVAGELSEVRTLRLDDAMGFSVSGTADSYLSVAKIWHNMCQQENYFETVELKGVSLTDQDENTRSRVNYSFSGTMIKENVDNL